MSQLPKEQKLQLIRIDRGISQFNHDYYAALGLPIVTSPVYIRHVYLSIARILHPDVFGFSNEEKQIATHYLAKLVNPAYNVLMKEQERQAYQGIFKLLAKRLMQKSRNLPIHSATACELMFAPSDGLYERSVSSIAKKQYQSLKNILEYTAEISELNLVYILYKEGYQYGADNVPPVLMPMVQSKNAYSPYSNSYASSSSQYYSPPKDRHDDDTIIQTSIGTNDIKAISDRLRICEIYLSKSDWKTALKELREILVLDKNNSKCLAMLGVVYKNINQLKMAKISLHQALQINPREPLALKHIKDLDNPNPTQTSANTKQNSQSNSTSKTNSAKTTQKTQLPPPQKRGWLSNLLGWASSDDQK
ncbi:MAG: molecular chaperone DnaJ [Pseudanabaena frigida]|uniref:Molecular chaperone DnaJ n=1 Tax=Pseudanabaena frigida TaxID=945775 RepID=A0A2W4VXP3_9CYAN|nr:MAG: molecular chaperone DnaJ [Pseudanabaena frigida]